MKHSRITKYQLSAQIILLSERVCAILLSERVFATFILSFVQAVSTFCLAMIVPKFVRWSSYVI